VYSGRARSQKYANASRTPTGNSRFHCLGEIILLQRQLGQPVVATVEFGQIWLQREFIQARDFADTGVNVDSFPSVPGNAAAYGTQRGKIG
jgi:hypothetical protein